MQDHMQAGAHGTCETIRVKADNEQGFSIINSHDFDDGVHELFDEDGKGVDYSKKTVPELKTMCEERGIAIPEGAKKVDIIARLEAGDE